MQIKLAIKIKTKIINKVIETFVNISTTATDKN